MAEKETTNNDINSLGSESSSANGAETEGTAEGAQSDQTLNAKDEELKLLNDRYLRLAAEFDNYKRIAQRDQRDQIKFGNEQLLKELLPVVDNLERAIQAAKGGGTGDGLVQGVDLTLKQLAGALGKFGVQPIPTIGQPFDPSGHQAVASVPSDDVPNQHVVEEFQRGYRLHDRILRAAMVTVSTGPAPNDSAEA